MINVARVVSFRAFSRNRFLMITDLKLSSWAPFWRKNLKVLMAFCFKAPSPATVTAANSPSCYLVSCCQLPEFCYITCRLFLIFYHTDWIRGWDTLHGGFFFRLWFWRWIIVPIGKPFCLLAPVQYLSILHPRCISDAVRNHSVHWICLYVTEICLRHSDAKC